MFRFLQFDDIDPVSLLPHRSEKWYLINHVLTANKFTNIITLIQFWCFLRLKITKVKEINNVNLIICGEITGFFKLMQLICRVVENFYFYYGVDALVTCLLATRCDKNLFDACKNS